MHPRASTELKGGQSCPPDGSLTRLEHFGGQHETRFLNPQIAPHGP